MVPDRDQGQVREAGWKLTLRILSIHTVRSAYSEPGSMLGVRMQGSEGVT